ncbi:putative retrograde regulation protein 2 [Phaeomoniella chlamydospora]|uniref:Putative retrograde regulation protein 2 n=1 Tax=Phaeomoniella chlamydospora TaxID=158046 RepID=A0A0G2GQ72_PHACM|nr:putative retrograde regulation protein 2 [Phaeomoniella chlamydospora]
MALQLDRANISQANSDNFLTDLHMNTDDFNVGNTVNKVCFLLAEIPSQLIVKGGQEGRMAGSPSGKQCSSSPSDVYSLSKSEEIIIVNRVIRDDPGKGTMHNRQPITPKLLWQSLTDYDIWPLYLIALNFQTPASPPGTYLTLSLKDLGFNTIQTNLLTIPYVAGTMITMIILTYVSEVVGELTLVSLFGQVWTLPFLIYINVIDITKINKWVSWAVVSLLLAYPSAQAIQVGWVSRNSNTVRSRAISAAVYNMFGQVAAIAASNIYQADDAPRYARGNRVLLILCIANIILYLLTKAYYILRNRYRDRKWNTMTSDEKIRYLETTQGQGNKRLDFRFAH